MRLTDEQIMDIKEYLNRSIKITISSLIPRISKHGLDLIDTIEALQQENEQLKDENASLRNWNACEEELHNELLESDKRRIELELKLEDANNYREGLETIIDKLRARVAAMKRALFELNEIAKDYAPWGNRYNGKGIGDIIQNADKLLDADTVQNYQNPADAEALRKAREVLEAIKRADKTEYTFYGAKARNRNGELPGDGERWHTPYEIAVKALAEIDKAIGGKEDAE